MTEILTAAGVFTGIVIALSAMVLLAKRWLAPSSDVDIVINNRQTCTVRAGDKLLWALAGQGIYLPAACGGRGTCGQCRVAIKENPPPLLPTESVHITRKDAASGFRLACMLTVRESLAIGIAEELLDVRRWNCMVVSNRSLSPFLKEVVLQLPEREEIVFEAGEYVLLEAPPHRISFDQFDIDLKFRPEWERLNLLDLASETHEQVVRAYSLANPPQDSRHIVLVVRIATPPGAAPRGTPPGSASSYIFGLKPGDEVAVSGPFGEFHGSDSSADMVFIAGGVGIAPIRSIIHDQLAKGSARRMSLWYGVRNPGELCYADEFRELAQRHENFRFHAAISDAEQKHDASVRTGLIHKVVYEQFLKDHPMPERLEYYLCGPPLMTTAVTQMLEDLGVDAEQILFDDFGAT